MKVMNATEAKNNFGLFMDTLMAEGKVTVTRNGRRISLCRATEEEMRWLESHRNRQRREARDGLNRRLSTPPPAAAESASAEEMMELLGIDEAEARELFPEKFPVK